MRCRECVAVGLSPRESAIDPESEPICSLAPAWTHVADRSRKLRLFDVGESRNNVVFRFLCITVYTNTAVIDHSETCKISRTLDSPLWTLRLRSPLLKVVTIDRYDRYRPLHTRESVLCVLLDAAAGSFIIDRGQGCVERECCVLRL